MKLLLHNEDFAKPFLEKIVTAYNDHPGDCSKIEIYISSKGGKVSVCKAALHIINLEPEKFKIVGYDFLASCGFDFFIRAECEKELIMGTVGMMHQSYDTIDLNERNRPVYQSDKAAMERNKLDFAQTQDFMKKCGFTAAEIKKVNNGDDLYFQYDRFKEVSSNYASPLH